MIDVNSLKVIAVLEASSINEPTRPSWVVTRSFEQSEPVENIVNWALRQSGNHGKLILTLDGLNGL
jgi:hypothetical protein